MKVYKPFNPLDLENLKGKKVIFTFTDGDELASQVKSFSPPFDNDEEEYCLYLEDNIAVMESEIACYEVVE
jgi:hypothetical protein